MQEHLGPVHNFHLLLSLPLSVWQQHGLQWSTWLPDGYSQIFRWYVFGPSGFWTMAPLRYAAKFDPFLSLDCAPTPSTLAQSKERKGSNFAAQRSGAIVQKPKGPNKMLSKNPAIAIWQPWYNNLPSSPLHSLFFFMLIGAPESVKWSEEKNWGRVEIWEAISQRSFGLFHAAFTNLCGLELFFVDRAECPLNEEFNKCATFSF